MTEKFRNKYRIASARLQTWDYSSNAAYFITLCTRNRKHFFGTIANGEMQLNAIGKIVETEWINTPAIHPDMNLELDEFVVMPNHFHAILIIGQNQYNGWMVRRDWMVRRVVVETQCIASLQQPSTNSVLKRKPGIRCPRIQIICNHTG